MPTPKRPIEADPTASLDINPHLGKVHRADSADFSGAVKKKLSGASRTGQACDRCKIRKIRCDARPGGCSPCAQNNAECKTTDRITGRATSRGHVETVESDNVGLRRYIDDLRRQLQEHGIEPRPGPTFPSGGIAPVGEDSNSAASDTATSPASTSLPRPDDPHSLANILNPAPDHLTNRTGSSVLPEYNPHSIGDNYLGVSSANEWPCPASGTLHSLFGMHLDLNDYVCSEDEEFAQPTTYESFFKYAYDERRTEPPPLPPYQQTRVMCEFWFKLGGSWLPVLHKPDFLAMVDKVYNDPGFKMSDQESVQFHCLVAVLLFQLNVRTRAGTPFKWSDHFRYAVSFWPALIRNSDLPTIQAMVMIMVVLRNFQRPGAYWVISSKVMTKVVEAGFHRSVRAWESESVTLTKQEVEMRKRIFWSVLQCHASLAIRLGRPMLVRLDDFDVELPDIINDNLPEEEQLPEHRKCSFLTGVTFFKLLIIQMQMYGQLFTIRPPRLNYEESQKRLDKQMDYWVSSIPSHLTGTGQTTMEDKAFALYLEFGHQGTRLMLHHPSFLRKPDDGLMKNNLDVCLDASSKLLGIAQALKALKMIDATWHNTTYYLNAIFTTLFAHSYRKDHLTAADLKALKKDMESWLDIVAEIGSLLGSGKRLPLALRAIMSTVILDVTKYLAAKSANSSNSTPVPAKATNPSPIPNANNINIKLETKSTNDAAPIFNASHLHPPDGNINHSQPVTPFSTTQPHPPYPTFSYPDPTPQVPTYSEPLYTDTYPDEMKTSISALAHSALATHQQQSPYPQPQQPPFYYANNTATPYTQPSNTAWRAFADNMSSSINHFPDGAGGVAQHWPATALMSLQMGEGKSPSPQQGQGQQGGISPGGRGQQGQGQGQIFTYDGMPQGVLSWGAQMGGEFGEGMG
ncbi:hypothetical protein K461DRAFT_268814 [Myriangium duriaei CBS 260.36]|uniref:Zn(2)-C6 fungal-type domain-containing protein n=1 Tax=Myriangium duriaei CBS 260.36 TaxID=1168546 RepID=A0A9P4IZQ9_9PEZI|nr:hypothetical protein K461DRAFT_268814 [Myriangium duriaei CBS 260.36]